MKLNCRDLLRRWQFPIMIACGTLPVALLTGVYLIPDNPWQAALPALAYVLMAALCMVIPGKLRLLSGVALTALLIAGSVKLLPWQANWSLLLVPGMYGILLLAGLPANGWPERRGVGTAVGIICVFIHVAAQLALFLAERVGNMAAYEPIVTGLRVSFLAFGALQVLAMNRSSVNMSTATEQQAPVAMKRKNTVLAVGLMAVTMAVACIPAVIEAFTRAWNALVNALNALAEWLSHLFDGETDMSGEIIGGESSEQFAFEAGESGWLAQLLEKIMMWVGLVIALVLLVVALRVVWKKLCVLLRYLWKRLSEYAAASSEDYVDEVADTREPGEIMRTFRQRFQRKRNPLKGVDERKLSPAARVRFNYLKAWVRHPEWEAGKTARENLTDAAAAELYERARYSDHGITTEEAEAFSRQTEKM